MLTPNEHALFCQHGGQHLLQRFTADSQRIREAFDLHTLREYLAVGPHVFGALGVGGARVDRRVTILCGARDVVGNVGIASRNMGLVQDHDAALDAICDPFGLLALRRLPVELGVGGEHDVVSSITHGQLRVHNALQLPWLRRLDLNLVGIHIADVLVRIQDHWAKQIFRPDVFQVAPEVREQIRLLCTKRNGLAIERGIASNSREYPALALPCLVSENEAAAFLDSLDRKCDGVYLLGSERNLQVFWREIQLSGDIAVYAFPDLVGQLRECLSDGFEQIARRHRGRLTDEGRRNVRGLVLVFLLRRRFPVAGLIRLRPIIGRQVPDLCRERFCFNLLDVDFDDAQSSVGDRLSRSVLGCVVGPFGQASG